MSVYKKNNGKWYFRFQQNGERVHHPCNGATTEKEAKELENQFRYRLQQQQNGVIPRKVKKVKLSVIIKLYNDYAKINKLSYGRDSFCKYIGFYFGQNKYVNDISVKDIEDFKVWLQTERNSSNSTVNKYLSALSKMFNLAIDNKLYNENPVKAVKKLREDNHNVRYLLPVEEKKMFEIIDNLYPYLRPIVMCALQTGMRKGEILNLQWHNINFEFNFIEILKTKSGRSRKIPLSDKLKQELIKLPKSSNYVFTNPKTNMPYTDIKKSFHTVLNKAGIKNFRFHDLRHTVATRMATQVAIPIVRDILGHSSISTTMRYAHVVPDSKREAIEVLNSYY